MNENNLHALVPRDLVAWGKQSNPGALLQHRFAPPRGSSRLRVAVITLLTITSLSTAATAPPRYINFKPFSDALKDAAKHDQITVIYFATDWCGWCGKMDRITFTDPNVQTLAPHFSWAKVNVDRAPSLAARFGTRGVPALALLNHRGEVLHQQNGYVTPGAMTGLLTRYVATAKNSAKTKQYRQTVDKAADRTTGLPNLAAGPTDDEAVLATVKLLASANRKDRLQLTKNVIGAGRSAWSGLVFCMAHEHLAIRSAAYALLLQSTGSRLQFDPFADTRQRDRQLQVWRDEFEQMLPAAEPKVKSTDEAKTT